MDSKEASAPLLEDFSLSKMSSACLNEDISSGFVIVNMAKCPILNTKFPILNP